MLNTQKQICSPAKGVLYVYLAILFVLGFENVNQYLTKLWEQFPTIYGIKTSEITHWKARVVSSPKKGGFWGPKIFVIQFLYEIFFHTYTKMASGWLWLRDGTWTLT